MGSQQEDDTVRPVVRAEDGLWLELATGQWMFAALVEGDHNRLPPIGPIGEMRFAQNPKVNGLCCMNCRVTHLT